MMIVICLIFIVLWVVLTKLQIEALEVMEREEEYRAWRNNFNGDE